MGNKLYIDYSTNRLKLNQLILENIENKNSERQNKITQLKKICDFDELKIVQQIYSGELDYEETYNYLLKNKQTDFLNDSYKIKNFLTTRGVSQSLTNFTNEREIVKTRYKDLCKSVWSDGIVTRHERKQLDDYCKKNKIDSITQDFLEAEILGVLKILDLNFEKIIEFYFLNDNLNSKEIQYLIKKDYKQFIDNLKIENVIEDLRQRKADLDSSKQNTTILYKLKFDGKEIQVISTKEDLSNSFNFQISWHKNVYDDFKIILKKEIVNRNNITEITDTVTDAICYKSTRDNDLSSFLEMKTLVRDEVYKQITSYKVKSNTH